MNYTTLAIGTKIRNDEVNACPYCGRIGLIQIRNEKIYVIHLLFPTVQTVDGKEIVEIVEDDCPKQGQVTKTVVKETSSAQQT